MLEQKSKVNDFKDLVVWKQAHEIRILAYQLASKLPETEKYNLISQIQRSAASIAANIAEGYGRFSYQENSQFCRQARGSLEETRDHLTFIGEIYPKLRDETNIIIEKALECRKTLNGYIKYLQERKSS